MQSCIFVKIIDGYVQKKLTFEMLSRSVSGVAQYDVGNENIHIDCWIKSKMFGSLSSIIATYFIRDAPLLLYSNLKSNVKYLSFKT